MSDKLQRIKLEPKELMKKRGLDSPDDADALALTFAQVVAPRRVEAPLPKPASLLVLKQLFKHLQTCH